MTDEPKRLTKREEKQLAIVYGDSMEEEPKRKKNKEFINYCYQLEREGKINRGEVLKLITLALDGKQDGRNWSVEV